MKHIKLFNAHINYNEYMSSEDKIIPNLCYCQQEKEIHFNKRLSDKRLITTLNVTVINTPYLFGGLNTTPGDEIDPFDNIEKIDVIAPNGNEFTLVKNSFTLLKDPNSEILYFYTYSFSETGTYTFKYTFINNTYIYNCTFEDQSLNSIIIPDTILYIRGTAFQNCQNLTTIEIPDSVIEINYSAFGDCNNLSLIKIGKNINYIANSAFYNEYIENREYYIYATTPPTIDYNPFMCPSYTIYVPSESLNVYKTAWSSFASNIQAIPSE